MTRLKDLKSGHIIEKTVGSSNEISFDVLRNKKRLTSDVEKNAPWEISAEALAKNKNERTHAKIIKCLVVATIVLALVAIGLLAGASWLQKQSGALDKLKTQMQTVVEVCESAQNINSMEESLVTGSTEEITNSITTSSLNKNAAAASKAKQELEKAKENITSTLADIGTPQEREAGNNAITLANKQILLIERFDEVYKIAKPFIEIDECVEKGTEALIQADSADREASMFLTNTNVDEAKQAIPLAQNSKDLAVQAKELFEKAEDLNENSEVVLLDASEIQSYVSYCELIAASQDATIQATNAYINRNKEELASANDEYNRIKDEAKEIASAWDEQITEVLADAYVSERDAHTEAFEQDLKEKEEMQSVVKKRLNN